MQGAYPNTLEDKIKGGDSVSDLEDKDKTFAAYDNSSKARLTASEFLA